MADIDIDININPDDVFDYLQANNPLTPVWVTEQGGLRVDGDLEDVIAACIAVMEISGTASLIQHDPELLDLFYGTDRSTPPT